jgi:hypothetical protein
MKLKDFVALSFLILALGFTGCGGGSSAQVQPSPPPSSELSISSLSPSSAPAGSPDLMLTITGTGFDGAGVVQSRVAMSTQGNETILVRTVTSATQIAATIPAALLKSPVTAQIVVQEYDKIENTVNAQSNPVSFTVTPAAKGAASISPSTETLGPQGARQFVFTNAGNNTNAVWAVEEGAEGGSITEGGLYTVPDQTGTFHVIATSVADPSKCAVATVSVVPSGFSSTSSMNFARSGHTATLLQDGKVLVAGGGDASAELFDPATEKFSPIGSMSTARYGATATLLASGKVLITGGFGSGLSKLAALDTAEVYDPQSEAFTPTGSMAVARIQHTATLLNDARVLIVGGTEGGGEGEAATTTAELYDPSSGIFTLTGSTASERTDHTATLLASGEVLVVGGWNGHAADAPDDPPWDPLFGELFEPSSKAFKPTSGMSTIRIGQSAIRLADGKVLVLGRVPSLKNIHEQPPDPQYAELYDPATGIFSSAGEFTLSRTGYTATLLANRLVLIAGGDQAGTTVTSAVLLESETGTLTATGGLVTARKGHTATRLNDGRVLLTGGTDTNGNALASAELYTQYTQPIR